MPLVTRSCIESIKNRVNIYDVVCPYVQLKRSGSSWRGLSPFTQEKTASFYVLPEKNIFKCFSSGYAGDIFRFLQLKENLSFQEAIETIADQHNMPLEYDESSQKEGQQQGFSEKKDLLKIYEIATHHFQECFLDNNPESESVREYWKKERNFSIDLAKNEGIGLAFSGGNALLQKLIKNKFSQSLIQSSGLFYSREGEHNIQNFLPRFRGRLIVPIRDIQGRVIAFAGRKLAITPPGDPAHDAKYINSPETPIFSKGRVLFGLHEARKHVEAKGYFILVEGQLDVLRCWEKGHLTAIAPQGTGVTEHQLTMIRRYTSTLLVVLDGDNAGRKAAMRIIPMAFKAGIEPRFIQLPDGTDPDTLLLEENNNFTKQQEAAVGAIRFALESLMPQNEPLSPALKAKILHEIFQILTCCESQVALEEYLTEIGKILHLTHTALRQDFGNFIRKRKNTKFSEKPEKINLSTQREKLTSVEHQLLLVVLNNESVGRKVARIVEPEWIKTNKAEGNLLLRILGEMREDVWEGISQINTILENEDEKNYIYSLLSEELPFEDLEKTAELCVRNIYRTFVQKKQKIIDEEIRSCDPTLIHKLRALQTDRLNLRKLLKTTPSLAD